MQGIIQDNNGLTPRTSYLPAVDFVEKQKVYSVPKSLQTTDKRNPITNKMYLRAVK